MKNAFELKPLLVAAVVGSLALYLVQTAITQNTQSPAASSPLLLGGIIGVMVQLAVRVVGVS
jgi:hypothetical protein